MNRRKKVAAVMTEYWDISHADVIVGKMLSGIHLDGRNYNSTLEIASFYVDQFPENDLSRGVAERHGIPIYDTVGGALRCGGDTLAVDGVLIIGEHGEYPFGTYGQELYPRRRLFEECLDVMLASNRIVPVFSDKHFAVELDDILWVWGKIREHDIPFMGGSVVVHQPRFPAPFNLPRGAPIQRMMGLFHGGVERYGFHALEMLQSVAESRAYGETGIAKVRAFSGQEAVARALGEEWYGLLKACCALANTYGPRELAKRLQEPVFCELTYLDGLAAGILNVPNEINQLVSAYQVAPGDEPYAAEFRMHRRPYRHFDRLVLEIERFMHTERSPFPNERTYLTTGALDACMRSLHLGREVETPHLEVRY